MLVYQRVSNIVCDIFMYHVMYVMYVIVYGCQTNEMYIQEPQLAKE